uniref:Reverse transcriptase zinc-binding domain-containing protein n=1 Tax=Cajanus cajan TaxID=3821 RepID=A0A151S2Y7_CAJCA|nr:hypothetical protein KK1_029160 [Cajanus cajan]
MFLWKVVNNALLKNVVRLDKHLTDDSTCLKCGDIVENADHLLRFCPPTRALWYLVLVGRQYSLFFNQDYSN